MLHVLFFLLLFTFSSDYAGFSLDAVVLSPQGFISIGHLQKDSCVTSYDVATDSYLQGTVRNHSTYIFSLAYRVVFDNDISFVASPKQLVRCSESWRFVKDLKKGDRLKCCDGSYAVVLLVEMRSGEQLLCEITVDPYHTFCVTPRGIIAHNYPIAIFAVAPPVISALSKVAIVGVVSGALWSLFGKNSRNNSIHNNFSTSSSCSASPPPPEDPRNKTKYKNMKQVFNESPMGEKLKKVTRRTKFRYKGAKIYKVIQDVEEWGIKKGDWLYLDTLHYDHLEVFDKSGEVVRTILNMDGTQNAMKLKQAGVRSIAECIG